MRIQQRSAVDSLELGRYPAARMEDEHAAVSSPAFVPEELSRLAPRPEPPRHRSTRRETSTILTGSVLTGDPTALQRFARVAARIEKARELEVPKLPAAGRVGGTLNCLKRMVGISDNVAWLRSTMGKVRTAAVAGKESRARGVPTNWLKALGAPRPISAFWGKQNTPQSRLLSHPDLLGYLDDLAERTGSPSLALSASFAMFNAGTQVPNAGIFMNQSLISALEDRGMIAHMLFNDAYAKESRDTRIRLAQAVLTQFSHTNQFESLIEAVCPRIVPSEQRPVLRRYLQAGELVQRAPSSASRWREQDDAQFDIEHGLQSSDQPRSTLARRVFERAQKDLAPHYRGPAASTREVAEAFFWDNHFRDDAPESDLHQLKAHFFSTLQGLGRGADGRGPFQAACRYGVAGADRHIFADEVTRVAGLIRRDEITTLVRGIQQKLEEALKRELDRKDHPRVDYLNRVSGPSAARLLALQYALRKWSVEQRPHLSLEEIVHGVDLPAEPGMDALTIKRECQSMLRRYYAEAEAARRAGVSNEDRYNMSGVLMEEVREELKTIRLGISDLADLARQVGVTLDAGTAALIKDLEQTISAEPPLPAAQTPAAVAQLLGDFLGRVQFGNHVRLSDLANYGFTSRGASVNISGLLRKYSGVFNKTPVVLRADARIEHSREHVMRAGAATHGGEIFMGCESRTRGSFGTGVFVGRSPDGEIPSLLRGGAGVDITPYSHDGSRYEGAMFRVERRITEEVEDPETPVFKQNDAEVRATMADMARMLVLRAPEVRDAEASNRLLEEFVAEFGSRGLSMTLLKRKTSSTRSELSVGISASVTTGGDEIGLRFGVGASSGIEKGRRIDVDERDTTGSYQVNNVRTGWFDRRKASVDLSTNPYVQAFGLPATPLIGMALAFSDGGATVRSRVPTKDGKIVAEKSFSDTESADRTLFKKIVLEQREKWVELFAYKYRHLDDYVAREKGARDLAAFFCKMDDLREETHVYYARERMHPDVAEYLDELSALSTLVPRSMQAFHAEIAMQRDWVAAHDASWMPASLIAYQRSVIQSARGTTVSGGKVSRAVAVDGEREIIFDTIGWPNLRQRERENPPSHIPRRGRPPQGGDVTFRNSAMKSATGFGERSP